MNLDRLHDLAADMALRRADMAGQRDRFARLASRHEDGTAPQAISSFNLFPTPQPLADELAALAQLSGASHILEPSAGTGQLVTACRRLTDAPITAVDNSADCCAALYRLDLPAVHIVQRDFLLIPATDLPPVDRVVMNPPFHMRADIRHTLHALNFLRPGGILAGVCMDTPNRQPLRDKASAWHPKGAAFRSLGTSVPVALFTIHI